MTCPHDHALSEQHLLVGVGGGANPWSVGPSIFISSGGLFGFGSAGPAPRVAVRIESLPRSGPSPPPSSPPSSLHQSGSRLPPLIETQELKVTRGRALLSACPLTNEALWSGTPEPTADRHGPTRAPATSRAAQARLTELRGTPVHSGSRSESAGSEPTLNPGVSPADPWTKPQQRPAAPQTRGEQ